MKQTEIHALIVAAGSGSRFCRDAGISIPKQFYPINTPQGNPDSVLQMATRPFIAQPKIAQTHVVLSADYDDCDDSSIREIIADISTTCHCWFAGGDHRAQSVANGLAQIAQSATDADSCWVAVHDAARPFLSDAALARLVDYLDEDATPDGAILALPVECTVKRQQEATKDCAGGTIDSTVDRTRLWLAQTPQLFPLQPLRHALQQLPHATDEAQAMEQQGYHPKLIMGERGNIKITREDDVRFIR